MWRPLDVKATFHSESQKAPELSAQPQLTVRLASRFVWVYKRVFSEWATVQELSDIALPYDVTRGQSREARSAVAPDETEWYVGVAMKTAKPPLRFHVVVEAADGLSVDEQETLVAVLNRRLADRRRAELAEDVREGRREFKRGALRPTTPDKIMKEILS